jgi:hypothetical protein
VFPRVIQIADAVGHIRCVCWREIHTARIKFRKLSGGVVTRVQRPLFDFMHKLIADRIIEQGIFIREVGVKRGAVNLRLVSHILHRDTFKIFSAMSCSKAPKIRLRVLLTRGSSFSSLGLDNIFAPVLLSQQNPDFDGGPENVRKVN